MEEREIMFKVPSVTKRRPNLYCTETVDDLDNVWNSPLSRQNMNEHDNFSRPPVTQTKSETSSSHSRRVLSKLETETEESKNFKSVRCLQDTPGVSINGIGFLTTTAADDGEFLFTGETFLSAEEPEDRLWFQTPRNKYTIGLLDELNQTETQSLGYSQSLNSSSEITGVNTTSPKGKSRSTEQDSGGEWGSPSKHGREHEIAFPHSPDVLIVRDESMANADSDSSGSDVDWESLTPPAPRSPGDHAVPELSNLNGITPTSDLPMYPYDNFLNLPPLREFGLDRDVDYNIGQMQPARSLQRNASSPCFDQMVPEVYF